MSRSFSSIPLPSLSVSTKRAVFVAFVCMTASAAIAVPVWAKEKSDKADKADKSEKSESKNPHGNPHGENPHGGHGGQANEKTPVTRPDEKHLKNIRQLTNGGENAEAYFNAAGTELAFQSKRDGRSCDQIYRMNLEGKNLRMVSTGLGRTTCSYIQNDDTVIYASTHGHGNGCLADPDHSLGYVWSLYPEMDIWRANADGSNPRVLFASGGYDAEATVCHKDGRIIFTSDMSGDLEVYIMDKDGANVKQITNTPGYDGGAFFSEDCSKIVWRASRPQGKDLEEYQALLKKHMVRPSKLEIYVADSDGKNVVQVTKNGAANFAPYLHPDNKRVLYVSNKADPKGRNFDIFMVNIDGTKEEQITTNPTFDGFPMFSPDGKKLVFASNRNNAQYGETNVFIADWQD